MTPDTPPPTVPSSPSILKTSPKKQGYVTEEIGMGEILKKGSPLPPTARSMTPRQRSHSGGRNRNRNWMPRPTAGLPGMCARGLEYLAMVDQVMIIQQEEPFEIATGIETPNSYALHNAMGQLIYFCYEQSDEFGRQIVGANRPWTLHVVDNYQNEVMRISRPHNPGADYTGTHQCMVECPPGNVVGWVRQRPGFTHGFCIQDPSGQVLMELTAADQCNHHFYVTSTFGGNIGEIRKMWGGIMKELHTDADNFGVRFPMSLPVEHKATLLGATFLIDFVFFEDGANTAATPPPLF